MDVPIFTLYQHAPSGFFKQTVGGWGILATVREYAKFGYLFLRNGEWDGQQIFVIPEEDIVIVRVGYDADPANDEWREVEFLTLVLNAIH